MEQREQDWDYLCLYQKHGEYSAAAKEAGVNVSSFKRRIWHYVNLGVMVGGKPSREAFDAAELYKGANSTRRPVNRVVPPAGPVTRVSVPTTPLFSKEEVEVLKALVKREQAVLKGLEGVRTGQEKVQGFRMDEGVFKAFQAHCKKSGTKMGSAITTAIEEYLERRTAE